jgi:hypothetical protein
MDVTLTEGENGEILAHRIDCPEVQKQRAQGRPLATLLGIEKPLPADVRRHSCLRAGRETAG